MRTAIWTGIFAMVLTLAIGISGTTANTSMVWADTPAQQGSAPAQPTGLSATATHDRVIITWDDPDDDSITGYLILRIHGVSREWTVVAEDTGTADTSYTDDTVNANAPYRYLIRAINEYGWSTYGGPAAAYTQEEPEPVDERPQDSAPAKPTGLNAAATHDTVHLTWDDPGDDSITGYTILRRVRENDVGGEFSELVPDTGSAATTYTDGSARANTRYTYRIKAINEHGASERSSWVHVETPATPTTQPTPEPTPKSTPTPQQQQGSVAAKPTGLNAATSHDRVIITWDDPDDDSITGYAIMRVHYVSGRYIRIVQDTGTADTSYTDDTVNANTSYGYLIRAINEYGLSEYSSTVAAHTLRVPEPEPGQQGSAPAKPTGLNAAATHDTVHLTWDGPGDDSITGYMILRRLRYDDPSGHFDELVANTGTAATGYTDDRVAADTHYTYRIKAINEHGASEHSSWVHVETPATPTTQPTPEPTPQSTPTPEEQQGSAPAKPTGLNAAATHDTVHLTWDGPGDDSITGYMILRRLRYDDPSGHFDELVANTGTAATGYTDDRVAADTHYTYRIKAINEHGASEHSSWVHVETPATPTTQPTPEPTPQSTPTPEEQQGSAPAKPTGLNAAATHDTVHLTWDGPGDDSITGYMILRRLRYDDPSGHFDELVANTGTAATGYTDDRVAADTHYTYRIKAINEHGASEHSSWVHVETPATPTTQPTPEPTPKSTPTPQQRTDDFADSTATTGLVAVGQSIVGRIETAGDVDWILIQAQPGEWFTITLTGYGEGDHVALETPYQKEYYLPDGSLMVDEHALDKVVSACSADCAHVEVSEGGSRYVAVASRTEDNTGSYKLTVTLERAHEGVDGGVDLALDISDEVDTRGFLRMLTREEYPGFNPAWNRVFGTITPQDVDWYRIDLEAGRAYRFRLRQSVTDLRLRLRDSTGTVIGSVRSGRTIHAAACSEGGHYIEVFRPDGAPTANTNYVVEAAYTDDLETAALRSILLNAEQVQLDWQCYGIADSHQVQFRLDGRWTTLFADGNNPSGIELESFNEGFGAKTAGLPTGDEYANYDFRIARVVDGAPTSDYREVSVVVIPDTPGNLRGGWGYLRYRDAATFEWNTVSGNDLFYEVQIKDIQDEKWVDLGLDSPTGVTYRHAGKTGIKLLAVSPRYVDSTDSWGYRGIDYVYTRVRATSFGGSSPWSGAFRIVFPETRLPGIEGLTGNLTGPHQATLSWTNAPDHGESNGVFTLQEYRVMFKIDGEWIHLSPWQAVNGVSVTFGHNNAVINGLPQDYTEYSFAVRHLGQVDWGGTPRFYISRWSYAADIPISLDRPNRPEAAQVGIGQVSVNWDPVSDATEYRLSLWTRDRWEELDDKDDGGVSITMSGTTATVSDLPSEYFWYIFEVKALGPNCVQQSAWSPNIAVFNQHRQGG